MARPRFILPILLSLSAPGALLACNDQEDSTAIESGGGALQSAEPPLANNQLDASAIADLEQRAERLVAAGVPGVSVAVLSGDQVVLIARGVADRATGEPMTAEHRFRVASISKSLVASVVLQLVEEGKIALGDSLDSWLPGMIPQSASVKIENLLRLESGIFNFEEDERHMAPYYAGDFEYSWSPEGLVALAAEHPSSFEPGTQFYYSNTNYTPARAHHPEDRRRFTGERGAPAHHGAAGYASQQHAHRLRAGSSLRARLHAGPG